MPYDNYNNFPWSIWILVIIITAGVVATAAVLIDFDDCLQSTSSWIWKMGKQYMVCTRRHTFNINSQFKKLVECYLHSNK